jgi:RNA polymerase sigma factor (sigma-70 family)
MSTKGSQESTNGSSPRPSPTQTYRSQDFQRNQGHMRAAGDVELANKALVWRFEARLLALAASKAEDMNLKWKRTTQEDLVSGILERTCKTLDKKGPEWLFDPENSLAGYLFTSIKKRLIGELRWEVQRPSTPNSEVTTLISSRPPTIQDLDALRRHCSDLLEMLTDKQRVVAEDKFAGYTNDEIAVQRQMSKRRVERHLAEIRKRWQPWDPNPEARQTS